MLSESAGTAQRNSTWMVCALGWRGESTRCAPGVAAAASQLVELLLRPHEQSDVH